MSRKIAIAGLGWLGLPLAQKLQLLGYRVSGSVTRLEKAHQLQRNGWDVYPVTLSEEGVKGAAKALLNEAEVVVVLIPPGLRRNTGSDHVLKMSHLLEEIQRSGVPNCILVSSISVYGQEQGQVTETIIPQPESEAGRQLYQVEQLFMNAPFQSTVVRFGGLFGGSRQPVRYLAGRDNLSGGSAPVNLIHREDCIGIITEIIKQQAWGHVFNAVHPQHPVKAFYYARKAEELNLTAPKFGPDPSGSVFKKVDSIRLTSVLNYQFKRGL